MANSRNGKEDVVDTLLDAKICGAPRPDSAPKFTSNGGGFSIPALPLTDSTKPQKTL